MLIDCDRCVARPGACAGCVVGVLLGTPSVPAARSTSDPATGPADEEPAEPGAPLPPGFGPVEHRALEVLADHGLIPHLRLVHAVGGSPEIAEDASRADALGRGSRDAG